MRRVRSSASAITFGAPWIQQVSSRVPGRLWTAFSIVLTYHYAMFAFSIWQTDSVAHWWDLIVHVCMEWDTSGRAWFRLAKVGALIALPCLIQGLQSRVDDPMLPTRWNPWVRGLLYTVLLVGILRLGVFDGEQFIYFQF